MESPKIIMCGSMINLELKMMRAAEAMKQDSLQWRDSKQFHF